VDTTKNAADIASRGASPEVLAKASLWWEGPEFIRLSAEHWPEKPMFEPTDEATKEERQAKAHCARKETDILNDFSTWNKMKRIAVLLRRWKLGDRPRNSPSTLEELRLAEERLLKMHQQAEFPELIGILSEKELPHTHRLIKLQPFMGEDGLLRVRSRLRSASHLDYDTRYPILLARSHLAEVILRHLHEELFHVGGRGTLLAALQRRFWLVDGGAACRRILEACVPCKHVLARPKPQRMGALPDFRSPPGERLAAFTNTGVDLAGPFYIKRGRAAVKKWVALFVCATYGCLHCEVVENPSADSFLAAFARFLARRPRPKLVVSDNATNFQATNTYLKDFWQRIELGYQTEYPDIEWRFITPYTPTRGGFYERQVRLLKEALQHIIMQRVHKLDDEEFYTIVTMAEGMINTRPIGLLSHDPQDPAPLTPAHFMLGGPYRDLAPLVGKWPLPKRFFRIQEVLDQFWERWLREVIPSLHKQNKWFATREALHVGQVVIVLDEKTRGKWPLGRITDILPSSDDLVREVEVLYKGKKFLRPIHRVLPVCV